MHYIGRDTIERQRGEGPGRRLVFLLIENADAWPLGAEPILHRDEVMGQVTTAVWAHSVGRAPAMGYVSGTRAQIAARIDAGGAPYLERRYASRDREDPNMPNKSTGSRAMKILPSLAYMPRSPTPADRLPQATTVAAVWSTASMTATTGPIRGRTLNAVDAPIET